MTFYRVHVTAEGGESDGYVWCTSHSAAERVKRDHDKREAPYEARIDVIAIKPTKAGVLEALRRFAGHPDNG